MDIYKKYGICGLRFDIGADGRNLTDLLVFDSLLEKHTWESPIINPTGRYNSPICDDMDSGAAYSFDILDVVFMFHEAHGALAVKAEITNKSNKVIWLNGFTFDAVLDNVEGARFRFPANVPHGSFCASELEELTTVQAGLVNFAVVYDSLSGPLLSILFIDEEEKWGTGIWRQANEIHTAFCAHMEANIGPGETIEVGTMYIKPCIKGVSQLNDIRGFVEQLGFMPTTGGSETSGLMYSCHPYGTMDAGFKSLNEDLFKFAERLPGLLSMGVNYLWLLPVFDHNEDGVYHSNDQDIIDKRYGGEEAARFFGEKAKELGITLMYDYVPHGPHPSHPLALGNPDWCSKKRDGTQHIEWNCVSMDYNHHGYLEYTKNLATGHARRFNVSGARIDCAMGGLSNWQPLPGKRPSSSSVSAGVKISKAIRDGFLQEGLKPLCLPENFNPIPPYYPVTDVFYGFNLYRVFCEIEPLFKPDPAKYASSLMAWLKDESELMPEGMGKLRFLGNHDTVSWVWQKRRATEIYGTEGAKAMWALIALIDGTPMIYQGDEDPKLYNNPSGPNLVDFFTELFEARKKVAPLKGTEYIETGTPIFAFTRGGKYLALINLGGSEEKYNDYTVPPFGYKLYEVF